MTFLTNAKGEPLLLLGTQTHNSSVGDPEMMARELAAVKAYGGNLLEAPIYWYKLEREPGQYDFPTWTTCCPFAGKTTCI